MKKITIVASALFMTLVGFSQTTSIPDPIFEQYLIDNGIDTDGTLNGQVATADISGVTSVNVSDMNISSLVGIQDFAALSTLDCSNNVLDSLDLSSNLNLSTTLNASGNQLTYLNLPSNAGLGILNLSNNSLTGLDFPTTYTTLLTFDCTYNNLAYIHFNNVTYINTMDCSNNLLTDLDFSTTNVEGLTCNNNPRISSINLKNGHNQADMYQFIAQNDPNLTCIYVDDVAWSITNWTQIDNNSHFVADAAGCQYYADRTYVPDDNFEQALIDQGLDDVLDNYVLTINISTIGFLDVSGKNINSLEGIQDFMELATLVCSNNNLTYLDLSKNHIGEFACDNNQLTTLILNVEAGVVDCSNNQLSSLDIPTGIANLNISHNAFTSLDLSSTVELSILDCSYNQLTTLDLRNGINNQIVNDYDFDARNNPDLTCIYVDDPAWSTTNWTQIDNNLHFVADGSGCQFYADHTYVPDDNFEQALIDQGYDDVLDNWVKTVNINNIYFLDITNKSISDLTGIEDFTSLETLDCSGNQLSTLDVSNNANLMEFACVNNQLTSLTLNSTASVVMCGGNQLTSLDVPDSTTNLVCSNNAITALDLSATTELSILDCSNNQLTSLDLRNGINNQIRYDYDFDARNNPNLTCIYVDDVNYSNTTWPNIDPGMHFVLDEAACNAVSVTYVPDDNFEAYLEANGMGNGVANDNYVSTSNISGVTSLIINNKNIADLTGIEDFTALQVLNCNGNTLTSIDVSHNVALKELYASTMTGITTLDVSHNTALEVLSVEDTHLNAIDVSTNTKLLTLTLANNNLTGNLDLTNNPLLEYFHCENNLLTGLNISNKSALTTIYCDGNQIANLNVSGDTALSELHCGNNGFTTLDLSTNVALTKLFSGNSVSLNSIDLRNGHNTSITEFDTSNSPSLSCVFVDDVTYSTSNWTHIDATTHFVPDEAACNAYTQVYVPDDNFEAYLEANAMGNGIANDNYASKAYIELQTDLDISNQNITDLTGIEAFTNLQSLVCSNNSLTSLDVTALTSLMNLHCDNNQLTSLTYAPSITELDCSHNQLTSVVVPDQMFSIDCSYNLLTALDVSANTYIAHVFCSNNQLTSLDMRNGGNIFLYSFDFDATNNPNLTCIFVDDPAWSNDNWASSIDSTSSFVASEADCGSTQMTYVPDNNFEQLLIDLGYDSGALDDFVITSHINTIVTLDLGNRDITDFTGLEDFVMLETIYCRNNDPVHLDLGGLGSLINIHVSGNPRLGSIVLPGGFGKKGSANKSNGANTTLITLDLHGNALTALDLSNYTQLTTIKVNDNNLTSLNVQNGNNSNIDAVNFDASGNSNLADIVVDDTAYAAANWPNVDPASTFTTDTTLGVENVILSTQISIYPNPAKDNIKIVVPNAVINKVEIYNFLGFPVKTYRKQSQYSIANLSAGMYLIKIDTDEGIAVKKLIIK